MVNAKENIRKNCINCNKCKNSCVFLEKYDMNLKDFNFRDDLRYSCFLCDKCKKVCPKDLSGKSLALGMRRKNPREAKKTIFMKDKYKLSNNSNKKSNTLLFLGCNYPGYFPKTSQALIDICKSHGIDYSIDCCKKPINDMGAEASHENLQELFKQKNTKRLITACPNCYHFLKGKLEGIEVVDPYYFLKAIGYGTKIKEKAHIFIPCSERFDKDILENIKYFAEDIDYTAYEDIICCGMGGGASKKEPDLVGKIHKNIKVKNLNNIYTYCATCAGSFKASRIDNIKNFLSEILEVHESPDPAYTKNVLAYKIRRH